MDEIGIVKRITLELFGYNISFSLEMLVMTWLVMAIILILAIICGRNLQKIPSKLQLVWEMLYQTFRDMTHDILGKEMGKKYTPMIVTLFIFILLSNWIGIFPPIFKFFYIILHWLHLPENWIAFLGHIPNFEEPTKFLSTDLALGIMVAIFVHGEAIKAKGLGGYLKDYAEPVIFFAPLNVVGELAKVVSHSFRLFGNILGGAIIIVIISYLLKYLLLPPFLMGFFGLFAGSIQAFVFTMLAATYLAVALD